MQDQTEMLTKPMEVIETETNVKTSVTGPPKPDETNIRGASGRFWVVILLVFGLIYLPTLYYGALIYGVSVDATIFLGIFTAYLGVAAIGIGTYLGAQGQKPKT